MAIRQNTLILKNSDIVNRPLPSTLLKGEAIVNTADGIMYFSGVTTSTPEWTPAGTGTTATFWEVGSNLYDLRLRNQITEYQSISGAGLVGKFLSGTTSGFVLANITDIGSVTSFNYLNNTFTITESNGDTFSATINTMTGLTVNGVLSATTANIGIANIVTENVTTLNATGATITTLNSTDITANSITATTISATTYLGLPLDIRVTGGTYNAGTATFTNNSGGTFNVTGFFNSTSDIYVTGFTYSNNNLTIFRNQGQSNLSVLINTMTGLTINGNLTVTGNTSVQVLTGTTIYANTIVLSAITQPAVTTNSLYLIAGNVLKWGSDKVAYEYNSLSTGDTSDSTNSTTAYVNKLTAPFTPNATGEYKVHWSCELTNDNNGNDAIMRVTQDGTEMNRARFNPVVNSVYSNVSGFYIPTLTSGTTYTFAIDFTTVVAARVAHIRRVSLHVRKIKNV